MLQEKAKTIESGLDVIFREFISSEDKIRSKDNLLERVEEKVFDDLCLMGYIRKGGTIINGIATITWCITKKGKDEYGGNKRRLVISKSDAELLEFYNRYN